MKYAKIEVIDAYKLITPPLADVPIDPEATKKAINQKYPEKKFTFEEYTAEVAENKVYANLGSGVKILTRQEEISLQEKIDALEEHQRLTEQGKIVPDYKNVEYWEKNTQSGRWSKQKIESIGVSIPEGIVYLDRLTADQQKEIAHQTERDRIAGLTIEQKAEELQRRLDALADEAIRLRERARLQKKEFDDIVWYEAEASKIQTEYT